jgi:hypothetical protein
MNFEWSKYKRVFTFGCSFTSYYWPSWADIIFQETPKAELYNFARAGSGNLMISSRLAEVNSRFRFNNDDLVLVMFTSPTREDRWLTDGGWLTLGNIYNQDRYSKEWVREFADERGYLIRDHALLDLALSFLETMPCDSYCMPSVPLVANSERPGMFDKETNKDISDLYSERMSRLPKSFYDFKYDKEYNSSHIKFGDGHPTTMMYYQYLKNIGFNLSEKTYEFAKDSTEKLFKITDRHDCFKVFPECDERVSVMYKTLY